MAWPLSPIMTSTLAFAFGGFIGMLVNPFFRAKFFTMLTGKVHYVIGINYPDKRTRWFPVRLQAGSLFRINRQTFRHLDEHWPLNNFEGVPFVIYDMSDAVGIIPKAIPTDFDLREVPVLDEKGHQILEEKVEMVDGKPTIKKTVKVAYRVIPAEGTMWTINYQKYTEMEKKAGSANILDDMFLAVKSMIEAEAMSKMIEWIKNNLTTILIGVGIIVLGVVVIGTLQFNQGSQILTQLNQTINTQGAILKTLADMGASGVKP